MIKSLLDKLLITCVRVSKRDHYYHPPLALLGAAYEEWLDAVKRFKADKGVRFATYAEWRITGAIWDYIRRVSWFNRRKEYSMGTLNAACLDELYDPASTQIERAESNQTSEILDAAILTLPERLRKIIRLYYYEGMTMLNIGALMGVGGSRISQLNLIALRMLREEIGGMV